MQSRIHRPTTTTGDRFHFLFHCKRTDGWDPRGSLGVLQAVLWSGRWENRNEGVAGDKAMDLGRVSRVKKEDKPALPIFPTMCSSRSWAN